MINNNITLKLAQWLGVAACDLLKVQEWANCYFVIARGQRPTFVSKKLMLPVIQPWMLNHANNGFNWQREQAREGIKQLLDFHTKILAMAQRNGWSFEVGEYGWRVADIYCSVYHKGLEIYIREQLRPVYLVGSIIETPSGAGLVISKSGDRLEVRLYASRAGSYPLSSVVSYSAAEVKLASAVQKKEVLSAAKYLSEIEAAVDRLCEV